MSRAMRTQGLATEGDATAARSRLSAVKPRSAEALLAKARQLLRDGEVYKASRLAAESAAGHPDHEGLRRIHELLNVGRSYRRPATGDDVREEIEWLRDPPEEYRGKWVAVIGRKVVGSAESLKELVADLPADLEQTPLAVEVAS